MDVRRVSVFCGTSATRDPVVEKEIRTFGQEVARRGITLVARWWWCRWRCR